MTAAAIRILNMRVWITQVEIEVVRRDGHGRRRAVHGTGTIL